MPNAISNEKTNASQCIQIIKYKFQKIFIAKFIFSGILFYFFAQTAAAQTIPPSATEYSISIEKMVAPYKNISELQRLSPPKTPEDFLKLIQSISEHFLLLDSNFEKDEFLSYIFGPGEITAPDIGHPRRDQIRIKRIDSNAGSLFKRKLKINYMVFDFSTFLDQTPIKRAASITFMLSEAENPFTAELIASNSGPSKWYDPASDMNNLLIQENMEAFMRRPLKTHPKGYFWIENTHENKKYISNLQIELHGNGSARLIKIDQKEK